MHSAGPVLPAGCFRNVSDAEEVASDEGMADRREVPPVKLVQLELATKCKEGRGKEFGIPVSRSGVGFNHFGSRRGVVGQAPLTQFSRHCTSPANFHVFAFAGMMSTITIIPTACKSCTLVLRSGNANVRFVIAICEVRMLLYDARALKKNLHICKFSLPERGKQ